MSGWINRKAAAAAAFYSLAAAFGIYWVATGTTLGSGVVSECTEAALTNAMSGGGTVTFACDGVIVLTSTKTIAANTVLDASGRDVTLNGFYGPNPTNAVRLFFVNTNISLTLINLKLVNGRGTNGGAVYNNGGTFTATNCAFAFNNAVGTPGAKGANGGSGNNGGAGTKGKDGLGGAVCNLGGAVFLGCRFLTNSAFGGIGGAGGNGGDSDVSGGDGGNGSMGGEGLGGALYNSGNANLTNCTFTANQVFGGAGGAGGLGGSAPFPGLNGHGGMGTRAAGGAFFSKGMSAVSHCTFALNRAESGDSAHQGSDDDGDPPDGLNGPGCHGGAICNLGTNTAINCTFYGSSVRAGDGGNGGSSTVNAGNGGDGGSGWGGNLYNQGRVQVTNCTFAYGAAFRGSNGIKGTAPFGGMNGTPGQSRGGNIANSNGVFILHNTILSYPSSGTNGYTTTGDPYTDGGFCLSSDRSVILNGPGSRTNTNPLLGPLADNGGPTMTMALLSGSPAIDGGNTNFCLPTDQRGFLRPTGSRCDIGAFEVLTTVTIFPDRGWASETGDVSVVSISRSGYFGPLTVQYAIGGTASNGVDYALITNSVTLGSNVVGGRVFIRPLSDAVSDNDETVHLTLLSSSDYVLGANSNAIITLHEQGRFDATRRYFRGTGTTPTYHTTVVPLDSVTGVRLADIGGNATNLFPNNPWTNTLYHFDATNPASQTTITGRCDFRNPIVAFGSRVGGTPLHVGQTYRFGVFAGIHTNNPIRLKFYSRTNLALLGTVDVDIPLESETNMWLTFSTDGYSQIVVTNGLTTVISRQATPRWGAPWHHTYVLSHTATTNALPYIFEMECAGYTDLGWTVLNATNGAAYSKLYTMEFESRPPWRATFIHQPHFAGQPLPSAYQGKSAEELLMASTFLATNAMPAGSLSWSNLNTSPELRRHPILDRFVTDLNRDPIALANYVLNEIELTDAFGYDDDGNVGQASVNLGGVNRSALATYQEGQGSPIEQCALLVYLLRQAGYPAAYMFPAEDSLKILDNRLSSILRLQLRGAVDDLGQTFTTNRLIAVNYPWVAAYIGTNWVHLFPWMKDSDIVEGLNLYDYMPTNYNNAYKWVRDYLYGKTNLFSLSSDDDTPATLFPKFVEQVLLTNAPGVSLDDIGVRAINRRNYYARWADFPKPTVVGSSNVVVEHLSSSTLTNLSPTLTNLFDTVGVEVYSVNNPPMRVVTGELRMADLHNRKFLVRHEKISATEHRLTLSLAPYVLGVTNEASFSALNPNNPTDANITNKLTATMTLDEGDDSLVICFLHKRQRTLPTGFSAPHHWDSFPGFSSTRQIEIARPFRKGDLAGVCLNAGRVTRRMLQVHAEEQWQMEQQLGTNSMATNSLPSDLYQGTAAYLQGMAYYEKFSRFIEQNERLHKVRNVSWFAAGLARLNAARNGSGQLPDGNIDLVLPTVDMFYNQVGLVGNGSLRPDSGRDEVSAQRDFFLLAIADGSAQEHAIINQFLIQKEAVSTVRLLRLAQQRGTNGQPGIVLLTKNNYLAEGEMLYPTNGETMLMEHDPQLWTVVKNTFEAGAPDADYSQIFITPWPVTNATASYSGMAALVMTPDSYGALISGSINGATGENLPAGSFGAANAPNADLNVDGEGNFSLELDAATTGAHQAAPEATATFDVPDDQADLTAGALDVNPNQVTEGQLNSQILDGQSGTYAGTHDDAADRGTQGRPDDRLGNGYSGTVADPVNTLTGEFYVDAVDLTLPGPMPLQVRRNYGSHNLSRNQLGFGWKLNYMPYLTLSQTTNFYVSEPDGSVLVFTKIGTDLWAPTTTNNPTLNNYSVGGMGSVANRLNARMVKIFTNSANTYFLTNADGSLRIFEEKSFSLSAGIDRLRPYLTKWFDNRGNFYHFEYGTNSTQPDYGQVRRILSSSGNLVGFQYDVYGRITEAYTLDGRRVRYRYDEHGDLVEVILPDASEWRFEYEHLNWTTNSVTYRYSTHLLTRESKPDGRALWNDYDDKRRVTNQAATVGSDLRLIRNASFAYVNNFNLTNLTATLTGTTTVLDYTNRALTYFYTNGLVRKTLDPLNRTNLQTWYEANETNAPAYPRSLKTLTDKRGLITEYKYDDRGNVTNTTVRGDLRGDGDTTATAVTVSLFNANNLATKVIDPTGTTNLFFYTNTWLLARVEMWPSNSTSAQAITNLFVYHDVTNAVDGTVSYGLSQLEIRAAYSSEAATNEMDHDSRGFVTRTLRYTGTADPAVVVTNVYNLRGELIEQTDAAGRKTRFAYDARGRREHQEVFESGQSLPLAWDYSYYNPNGELVWSDGPRYDPEDYVWRDFDGDGRLCAVVRWRSQGRADGTGVEAPTSDALYSTTFYDYDPFGNQTRTIDPRGIVTTNTFDAVGQLLVRRVLDTNGVQLTSEGFAYELGGLVTRHTNALGGVTETLYTSTGKPCFHRNPDGSTNGWTYLADGRPRREIRQNGAYWETSYDDANRRVTRIFYFSTNALATNVVESDRRGNVIRTVDAGGFVSTNRFDALDRVKVAAGPAIISIVPTNVPLLPGMQSSNMVQQSLTYVYDGSGQVLTVTNGAGEITTVTRDALHRVIRTEIRDTNNATVRLAATAYAANHHGVTTTNGSGSGAIVTTTYTDHDANTVLSIGYPSANVTEFTWQAHDVAGNRVASQRVSRTNSQSTVWATNGWTYDGLNRVKTATARDGATTTFDYDPAGNVTNRAVPGNIAWRARYNNAGQRLDEYDSGAGLNAHTNLYTYYPASSPYAGLLQTNVDGRRVTCVYNYDHWLRPATNTHSGPLSEHHVTTVLLYDARGLLTNVTENFTNAAIGPTNCLALKYDAYRQLLLETILTNNVLFNWTAQSWDAAGRRTGVDLSRFGFAYGWRADGLVTASQGRTGGGTYSYDAAGQLASRVVGARTTTITSRDGTGRPLGIGTTVSSPGGAINFTEALAYTGDGLMGAHTVTRPDFTDQRAYTYASWSRRLTEERLNLASGVTWTNAFTYDNSAASGPGVLTRAGPASTNLATWSGATDALARITTETNTALRHPAYGLLNASNGTVTVRILLDNQPQAVTTLATTNAQWPTEWRATVEMGPGAHQLKAEAVHSSARHTNATTHSITNSVGKQTATDTVNAGGYLTQRIWKNPNGTTNRTQTFSWDARGRLVKVVERDSTQTGLDWTAFYDPLGRRFRTTTIPVTNGTSLTAQAKTTQQYFDPEVKYLTLGVMVDGKTTWKLHGPDVDETYGGLQGRGGFDAIVPGPELFCPTINDARGNVLAVYDQTHGKLNTNQSRPTAYGAVPGYRPPPLGHGADLVEASAFASAWADPTGLYCRGARYYDPVAGRWLSPDPMGHGSDPSLFAFADGDPVNRDDPDGMVGRELYAFLEREYWNSPSAPYFQNWGNENNEGFHNWLNNLFSSGTPSMTYQPPTGGRSFGAQVGAFAANNFLNAEAIQDAWREVRNPDFSTGWGWAAFGVGAISLAANTADVAGNILTLGGKGAAESGVKAGLKEVVEAGAKDAAQAAGRANRSTRLIDDTFDPLPQGQDMLSHFRNTDLALQNVRLRTDPIYNPNLPSGVYGRSEARTAIDLVSEISPEAFRNRRQLIGTIVHEDVHLRISERIRRGSQSALDLRVRELEEAYVKKVEARFLQMQNARGR